MRHQLPLGKWRFRLNRVARYAREADGDSAAAVPLFTRGRLPREQSSGLAAWREAGLKHRGTEHPGRVGT